MRLFHLTLALVLLAAPSALSQSMRPWKSVTQTRDIRNLVLSLGSDSSIAAWVGQKTDVLSCRTRDKDVFLGGNNSVSQMVDENRYSNTLRTGRASLYLSVFTVNNLMVYGDALGGPIGLNESKKIITNFAPYAPGISEEFYDRFGTPSLPSSAHNDGGVANTMNGPLWYAQIGFKPTIMMMNINDQGRTPQSATEFNIAEADIKKGYPSVKYVYPYINDGASFATDPASEYLHPDFANSDFWAGSRSLIMAAGGVGIDVPTGLAYATPYWPISLINEIKWANLNGIRTVVLLTPYNTDPSTSSAGGQFSFDSNFKAHTKWFVAKLRSANALPSAWVVSNYSNWGKNPDGTLRTSNLIGTDADIAGQSVASVARWVAENAPTSTSVPLPAGSEGGKTVPCAAHVNGEITDPNQTIGAQTLRLGSLAYEDISNPKFDNLTVNHYASIGGNLNVATPLRVKDIAFFCDNLTTNTGKAIVLGKDRLPI